MNVAGMGGTLRLACAGRHFQNPTGFYNVVEAATRKFQCYAFVRVGFRPANAWFCGVVAERIQELLRPTRRITAIFCGQTGRGVVSR